MSDMLEEDDNISLGESEPGIDTAAERPRFMLSLWNENTPSPLANAVTTLGRDGQSLSPRPQTPLESRRHQSDDDDISICTLNDRGYAAAEMAFDQNTSSIRQNHDSVAAAESDLSLIGSHLQYKEATTKKISIVKSLGRDVYGSLEYFAGRPQGSQWLPVNHLFRIVTKESVFQALKESIPENSELREADLRRCAEAVCPPSGPENNAKVGSRSVFAILTLLEKVGEIRQFIELDLSDDNLPFVPDPNQPSPDGQLFPKGFDDDLKKRTFGSQWSLGEWGAFERYQRTMRSPYFAIGLSDKDRGIPHYELEPDTVLPFIAESSNTSSVVTSNSHVRRVQIHMHHHAMHKGVASGNPFFAVKELLAGSDNKKKFSREKNFREEVRAWAKTVGLSSHDHVIKLLATWRKGDSWNMLFPWARSNLKDYWEQNRPERSPEFVHWISTQCRGLVEGLKKIHRSPSDFAEEFGIHGDIKPENILIFDHSSNPYGIMVISDFGYTRFHGINTRSNAPAIGYSPTHRAPELNLQEPTTISRSYDIWTFGCVFLEFITWYLKGPHGIRDFVGCRTADDTGAPAGFKEDKFFIHSNIENNGEKEPVLKPSVNKWINHLRKQPYCGGYFRDFLDLIVKDLLQPIPKDRESCAKIAKQLKELEDKCKPEPSEYLMGQGCATTSSRPTSSTNHQSSQKKAVYNARAYSPVPGSFCDETWGPKSDRGSLNCASHGEMNNIAAVLSRDSPPHTPQKMGQESHQSQSSSPRMELQGQPTERTPLIASITKPCSCLGEDSHATISGAQPSREASESSTRLRSHDGPFKPHEMTADPRTRNEALSTRDLALFCLSTVMDIGVG
ncbi:kinase-like domain-containing protein [Colletotrichum phormii]|uniref:Kinase-like domain-containing protein n=1 Tax=Colletotrichum phormii TaxID=359342 RepID=A0AAJ0ECA1_9PEZI|nr:kinase-like domain-containing protein [Colletotrichum phormii]KAK1624437.1 kinase-like domain-containing protein [Colletotrichum phormii]